MNDQLHFEENKHLESDPLDALFALHQYDLDPWRTETLRIRARERFIRSQALAEKRWLNILRQTYRRVLEPAFVIGVSLVNLVWAFTTVFSLLKR